MVDCTAPNADAVKKTTGGVGALEGWGKKSGVMAVVVDLAFPSLYACIRSASITHQFELPELMPVHVDDRIKKSIIYIA